ncbi:MAG: DUF192 domain-containing protein [Acidimicrobiales bacterium]|nr:DUF192 domain-containing protein [Acidimicrobiales bacterium]
MAWLLRGGEVLASLTVASSRADRRRGLLGRDSFDGALLIERARSIHTFGMRFPIDVAFCDEQFRVVDVRTIRPGRLTLPVRDARCAIEAEAGSFATWELRVGDELEVRR